MYFYIIENKDTLQPLKRKQRKIRSCRICENMWWTHYSIGYESGSDFEENLKDYEGDESDEENGPDEWLTDKYVNNLVNI